MTVGRRRGARAGTAWLAVFLSLAGPVWADDPPKKPADEPPASTPDPEASRPRGWDDKRRTMRSYGSNLLYNFVGVGTTGNHRPLVATVALTAPAFAWDDEGIDYFRRHPHDRFGDIGATLGGTLAAGGLTVGVFAASRISHGGRLRSTGYDLSQAIIITQVYTQALKFTVRRERPDGSNRLSFPSGHASNAFTAATVVTRHYPRLAVPGFAVATYIAVSRMAANKHHFSDIVAGAGFGFGVGRAVVRRNGRPPDTPGTKDITVSLLPDNGPAPDGRGLRLVVSF